MNWPLGPFPTFLAHEIYDEDFFFSDTPKRDAREGDILIVKVDDSFVVGTVGKMGRFEQLTLFQASSRLLAHVSWADDDDQKSPDEAWLISRVTA